MSGIGRLLLAATLIVISGMAAATAGTIRGIAVDEDGKPLAGVHVEITYQSVRAEQLHRHGASIKATAVTERDGRYEIAMDSLPPGEYAAHAYRRLRNGDRELNVALVPDDASPIASNERAVRNFTARMIEQSDDLPYGNGGVFVVSNAVMDYTDLSAAVVTLVNVDTQKTYVKTVRNTGEGLVVTGIPFGTYRASISVDGTPFKLALHDPAKPENFAPIVTHTFTMGYLNNQFRVTAKR